MEKEELKDKLRETLELFLNGIRDYEGECGHSIHSDERDSMEFVDIFLDSEDGDLVFDVHFKEEEPTTQLPDLHINPEHEEEKP